MREPDRVGISPLARHCLVLPILAFGVLALVYVFFFPRLPVAAQSTQTAAPPQSPQQKIIGRDCRQCHQVIVEAFTLDAHGKSGKFLNDSRASVCESCHGNSDKHAENSSRTKSAEGTINPAKIPGAELNRTCL